MTCSTVGTFNGCHRCLGEARVAVWWMVLCPKCGNKRCPHASDCRLACTNSNEPGQTGSIYGPANSAGERHG